MVEVNFLGPIKKDSIKVEVKSLFELKEILSKDKELYEWLKISAIAVNDKFISSIDCALKDGDIVNILPPVCGG